MLQVGGELEIKCVALGGGGGKNKMLAGRGLNQISDMCAGD